MKKTKSIKCLNCGAEINEANYCHNCGQPNKEKIISLRELLHDFFGDYFTFDSKLIRSIFPLMFKPGHLTSEYVTGKRVSYILPLRLYLFTTFVFFFVLALNAKFDSSSTGTKANEKPAISRDSLLAILDQDEGSLPEDLKEKIVANYDSAISGKKVNSEDWGEFGYTMIGGDSSGTVARYISQKAKHISSMGDEAGAVFVKEMINQIPKVLFILLPMFALFLKLLFIRHKRLYIEHLVFSLHIHTFVFLVLFIPLFISHWISVLFAGLAIVVYLFIALHNFYEQSYPKAFVKLILISGAYLVALIPAMILIVLFAVVSI